jgi:hypothetical protein
MADAATIQIKIGALELICSGGVDRDQLEDVLRTIKRELPELVSRRDPEGLPLVALLEQSNARTFGEKAGVVAYWLEAHQGRTDWRSADIVDALRDANEDTPKNITDALNQKLKKGLFEVHDRRWKLTGEGRGWVKYSLLPREGEEP